MPNSEFNQIKKELIDKVNGIDEHIKNEYVQREEVRVLIGKVSAMVFGDASANPPIIGFHERLNRLESVERDRIKTKDNVITMAVGSMTIAIGGAVIWIACVLREAFVKPH
jgi:hypothetical protein